MGCGVWQLGCWLAHYVCEQGVVETDFVFSDGAGLCSRVSHSETGNLKSIVTSKLLLSSA